MKIVRIGKKFTNREVVFSRKFVKQLTNKITTYNFVTVACLKSAPKHRI